MIGASSRNLQTQKTELLSREEEYDLILRAKAGDERAINRIIRSSRGLIAKEAQRYKGQVDWPVLIAAGEWGVVKAIRGFNLSTGNRFSTYAVPVIRSEIRDCACRETGVSRTTMKNLGKISRASTDLTLELERDPTLAEIIERSELSEQQILTAWKEKTFSQPASLNRSLVEGGHEFLDLLEDKTIDIWVDAQDGEILGTLDQLENNGHLEERQIQILIAKHQGYTNKEVGRELGVSGERVRQLFKGAREALSAFIEGTLKPIKTTISVSTPLKIEPIGEGDQLSLDLPVPEQAAEPVVKRVDASRLGGRIGRVVKQIFSQTKVQTTYSNRNGGRNLDDQILERQGQSIQRPTNMDTSSDSDWPIGWTVDSDQSPRQNQLRFSTRIASRSLGGITNAEKHLLVFCRGRSDGLADRSGCQSASKDQRCHRLGQVREAWRGCLEVGQVISRKVVQPFASAYQRIRGFGCKLNQGRTNVQLSTANVFENFGIAQEHDRARPPTDYQDRFSPQTNHFPLGGMNMSFAHKKATAFGFALVIFASILCWGLINDNWSRAPESLRPFSSHDLQFLGSTLVSQSKFLELSLTAGYVAWLSRFLALSGLNVVYPSKEDA